MSLSHSAIKTVYFYCSYHISSLGKTHSHPAFSLADEVKIEERRIPFICIDPNEIVTVVGSTAMWVAVAKSIFTSVTGLQQFNNTIIIFGYFRKYSISSPVL